MLKKLLLFFLFFTLVYKPEFIFIPHSVNMFFGLLGIIVFLSVRRGDSRSRLSIGNNMSWMRLFCYAIPIVVVSILSIFINNSFDFYYPRYAFSLVLGFFSFYLLSFLFKRVYGRITVETLTDYFVISECVFLFIGLASFFSPNISSFLTNIQKYNDISVDAMARTEGYRLISIGAQFFSAAIINGFVLIIIGLRFRYCADTVKTKVLYLIAFVFITAVGMMMARATLVGALLGLFLILWGIVPRKYQKGKSLLAVFCVVIIAVLFYHSFKTNEAIKDFEDLTTFGFEMFINYKNGEGFTAHSNNRLLDMYNSIPSDIQTWLIGDGRWMEGDHYYKRVDTGYLRGLWYFGIVGLVCLFWYYYQSLKYLVYKTRVFYRKGLIPLLLFLLYVVVLNLKGPVDLFFLLIPFYFCDRPIPLSRN